MGATETVTKTPTVSPFRASLKVAYRRLEEVWLQIRHSRMALVGLAILIFFTAVALLAPLLAPYWPLQRIVPVDSTVPCTPTVSCPLSPPNSAYPLGVSFFGMDIYSQVIWGTQVSLIVGVRLISRAVLREAQAHRGDWNYLRDEMGNLLGAFEEAVSGGRAEQAGAIARLLEGAGYRAVVAVRNESSTGAVADLAASHDELTMLRYFRHRFGIDRLTAAAIERGAQARHAPA